MISSGGQFLNRCSVAIKQKKRMLQKATSTKGGRSLPKRAKKIVATLAGLEPTRENPNRFLVDRLNRSATVSTLS